MSNHDYSVPVGTNIGIGTANPEHALVVFAGPREIVRLAADSEIIFATDATEQELREAIVQVIRGFMPVNVARVSGSQPNQNLHIFGTGNVGIGG